MTITIRPITSADWPVVRSIYEDGIATGNATFETTAPSWDEWDASHLAAHRLVAVDAAGGIAGWAALSPDRCAYAGVAESSVYVGPARRGHGVGGALLEALVSGAEAAGVWTIQAGIFPENRASIALHERCGFRIVGRRERSRGRRRGGRDEQRGGRRHRGTRARRKRHRVPRRVSV